MGNQKALHDGKTVVADKEWLAKRDGGAFSESSNGLQIYKAAVQNHIDSVAQGLGYENSANLASYVNSTISEWASQAIGFVKWRDQVWTFVFSAFADMNDGKRVMEPVDQFILALPSISEFEDNKCGNYTSADI
ncbi:hypothetical protein JAU75_19310 [Ochrobactrum sp. Q0168]|uniref:hypothetical protein n=1 Tax=Ochrobactrum sp. Q0168 TaxID=2793241 RepID=UPI0018ECC129|nr:hypothetical protein [Ochrobactrum sp. Q0168]